MSSENSPNAFVNNPEGFLAQFESDVMEALDNAGNLQAKSEAAERVFDSDHHDDPARERLPGYSDPPVVPLEGPPVELTQATLEDLGLEKFELELEDEETALRESIAIKKFAEDLVAKKAIHLDSVDVIRNKVVAKYRPFRAALSSDSSSGGDTIPKTRVVETVPQSSPRHKPPKTPSTSSSATTTPTTSQDSDPANQTSAFNFCNDKVLMKGYGGSTVGVQLSTYDCSPALAIQYAIQGGKESWMLDPSVPVDKKVYWLLTQHKKAGVILNALSPLAYP